MKYEALKISSLVGRFLDVALCWFLIFIGFLIFSVSSQAAIPAPIILLGRSGNKIIVRNLSSRDLSEGWKKTRSNPPHRQLNPEHKTSTYEGIELRKLLTKLDLKRSKIIYVVGSDGYISMISADTIWKYPVMLAFKKDDQILTRKNGEQQIIFPTEDNSLGNIPEKITQKAAFWTWYVRSLISGDLPNEILLNSNPISRLNLKTVKVPVTYVPPSVFSYEPQICPIVTSIPLNAVLAGRSHVRSIFVKLLSGQSLEVASKNVSPEMYRIIFNKDPSVAIPVNCGGPFLLLKPNTSPLPDGRYRPDNYISSIYDIEVRP